MDKATGKPLSINGKEIRAESTFTPNQPSGEAVVAFTFDSKYIKADTDLVVFERLYREGKELAVHTDLEDEGQTVTVTVPQIGTQASIEGNKEVTAGGVVTIEDVVSYKNLTPGKEYTIKGILMDKRTGKAWLVNGNPVTSEVIFTPAASDGEEIVAFTFDTGSLAEEMEIVVFESLYRNGVEIATHADLEDDGQTVTLIPQAPEAPQTGYDSTLGFWIGLGAVAIGGLTSAAIIYFRQKKEEDSK